MATRFDSRFMDRWREPGGYRDILKMAVPLVLSTGASTVLHFVDRMFLSWYSAESIAAAMPAAMLNFAAMSFFIGTAGYVNTFVAQYEGAKQPDRIGPALYQGLYIAAIGGFIVFIASLFSRQLFDFVGHVESVRRLESEYFAILSRWAIFPIAAAAFSGFFSGRGQNWPVMWANLIGLVVNVVLDYGMIFGKFGFRAEGIVGAGRATVIAGAVLCLVYCVWIFSRKSEWRLYGLSRFLPDRRLFRRILIFGAPNGAQFLVDWGSFAIVVLLIGRLGLVELAATNLAFNINGLAFMPMLGIGIAISVVVGRFQGAGSPEKSRRSTYSGMHICFLYMALVAITYVVVPDFYVSLFGIRADPLQFEPIRRVVIVLLRFVAIYTLVDTLNIVFASALKGAGDTRFVMFMIVVVSLFGLTLPTYLAIELFDVSIYGVWLIVSIYVALLGGSFYLRFITGKWKSMKVIESAGAPIQMIYPSVPVSESEV